MFERRVFGRVIPQVLLTHLGGWSAVTLLEVLRRLDAVGARYVTLAEAQRDPAYARTDGGNVITRVAKERGVKRVTAILHSTSKAYARNNPAPSRQLLLIILRKSQAT